MLRELGKFKREREYIMAISDPAYPSSSTFDKIEAYLRADEQGRNEAVKATKAVFRFNLKSNGQEVYKEKGQRAERIDGLKVYSS